MANNDLKLLGAWFSPFANRVNIALNIKSLEYENHEETLSAKSDLLLQSNPVHKKVPVLLHGDKAICESRIILEYIDEVWTSAPSILPSDPYDRATARFWAAFIDDKWSLSLENILLSCDDDEAKKTYFEEVEEELVIMEDALEKCSKGKPFFGGDHIGLVDIIFGTSLRWLSAMEIMNGRKVLVESKTPALVKWAQRFVSDPNVKSVLPETEKLIEYGKAIQIRRKAAAAAK